MDSPNKPTNKDAPTDQSSSSLPILFLEEIQKYVGQKTFAKAKDYTNSIRDLRSKTPQAGTVGFSARCASGSTTETYTVIVKVSIKGKILYSHCSCPVGKRGRCKHCAATLVYIRQQQAEHARIPIDTKFESLQFLNDKPSDDSKGTSPNKSDSHTTTPSKSEKSISDKLKSDTTKKTSSSSVAVTPQSSSKRNQPATTPATSRTSSSTVNTQNSVNTPSIPPPTSTTTPVAADKTPQQGGPPPPSHSKSLLNKRLLQEIIAQEVSDAFPRARKKLKFDHEAQAPTPTDSKSTTPTDDKPLKQYSRKQLEIEIHLLRTELRLVREENDILKNQMKIKLLLEGRAAPSEEAQNTESHNSNAIVLHEPLVKLPTTTVTDGMTDDQKEEDDVIVLSGESSHASQEKPGDVDQRINGAIAQLSQKMEDQVDQIESFPEKENEDAVSPKEHDLELFNKENHPLAKNVMPVAGCVSMKQFLNTQPNFQPARANPIYRSPKETKGKREYLCRDCKKPFMKRGDRDNHESRLDHFRWRHGGGLVLPFEVVQAPDAQGTPGNEVLLHAAQ